MRAKLIYCLILFTLSSGAYAQNTIRRLPPSLERELKLRKGGKVRIIGFIDTLKAQTLIAQSIRDNTAEELDSMSVRDTAIIVIDSSVSLTDKEWLDSMLAELPEYRMTPDGVRFQYPAEILVETTRKIVPLDTTLSSKMDPVTKEDLPLYDASPMPRPLARISLPGTSIELGGGAPYLPRVDLRSLVISNEKSALELSGKYRLTEASEPAVKQFLLYGIYGEFAFPTSDYPMSERSPQLDIDVTSASTRRLVITPNGNAEHTMYHTDFGTDFTIGSPSQLELHAEASLTLLNDDTTLSAGQSPSENRGAARLMLSKDIGSSPYRIELDLRYDRASAMPGIDPVSSPTLFDSKLLLINKETSPFQWRAGLIYLGGSDVSGSISQFSPIVSMKLHVSHSLEIGAGFEPTPQIIGLRELVTKNLFYSPTYAASVLSQKSQPFGDMRRITSEPIHLDLFANYFLSLDDELHAELRYITRNNEPTFYSDTDSKGHILFVAAPMNTRRIELEAGGSLLLFIKDKLRASLLFRTASDMQTGLVLPFEPTAQIQALYQFGNISEKFIPHIEFIYLSRVNRSFSFINIEAPYSMSKKFQLKIRAENIFGSAGDFWTGYNEYPRAVWVSAQYSF